MTASVVAMRITWGCIQKAIYMQKVFAIYRVLGSLLNIPWILLGILEMPFYGRGRNDIASSDKSTSL